jgi:hypothetical protein
MPSTGPQRAKIEPKAETAMRPKIVLHPSHMERAFFLVPEERLADLRGFLAESARALDASRPTLSLKTVWQLVKLAWRGQKLPTTLSL